MLKRIVIIIISLLCIGVIVYCLYYYFTARAQEQLTSPLQPTPTIPKLSPTLSILEQDKESLTKRLNDFYLAYKTCEASPPAQARGRVSTYCQVNTGFTTVSFAAHLAAGGAARSGIDPITCSQNPPESVSVESIDFEDPLRAVASVVAQFGAGFAEKISVLALKDGEEWFVDNVTCPKP